MFGNIGSIFTPYAVCGNNEDTLQSGPNGLPSTDPHHPNHHHVGYPSSLPPGHPSAVFARLSPYENLYSGFHASPTALSLRGLSPDLGSSTAADVYIQALNQRALIASMTSAAAVGHVPSATGHHSAHPGPSPLVPSAATDLNHYFHAFANADATNAAFTAAAAAAFSAQEATLFRTPSGSVAGFAGATSRKRALSISPYSDNFDINSVIRFSPNSSLASFVNGSRNSSANGCYGHLSAGTLSPSLGVPTSTAIPSHLHHLIRSPISLHPMTPGGPANLGSNSVLSGENSAFTPHSGLSAHTPFLPQTKQGSPTNPPVETAGSGRETASNVVSSTVNDSESRNKNKPKREEDVSLKLQDDEKNEEIGDFVETNCHWKDCGLEFNTQNELVKHIKDDHIQCDKKSFVCRWKDCTRDEKPFKAQYMLVVHMRRHTGEKPHQCTFEGCTKAYSRLENLKTHIRSHTGEKPYQCEYPGCPKAFSNASDRAKHQNRTHSNEKPYECKVPGCLKKYTDPSSLRKHVKTVHGPEFYANKKHKGIPSSNGSKDGNSVEKNPDGSNSKASSPTVKSEQSETTSSPDALSPMTTSPSTGPTSNDNPIDENSITNEATDNDTSGNGNIPNGDCLSVEPPISDNSVSTTCMNSVENDWCHESVPIMSPNSLMVSECGALATSRDNGDFGTASPLLTSPGMRSPLKPRTSFKNRLKNSFRSATNWIPSIFNPRSGQRCNGSGGFVNSRAENIPLNGGRSCGDNKKNSKKSPTSKTTNLVRTASTTSSINSFYSSVLGSDNSHNSQATTSSSNAGLTQCVNLHNSYTSGHSKDLVRCSSYDPISIGGSSRRSSNASNSSFMGGYSGSHHQNRRNAHHLSQTDNLVVQPQSIALSSGFSSDGFTSSLSTLNSTASVPPVVPGNISRSDTTATTSNSTATVATEIHHPNENVNLEECDSDQPIENNDNLLLPDEMVQYLTEKKGVTINTTMSPSISSSNFNLDVPNMPPGPLSPNSMIAQLSPSSTASMSKVPSSSQSLTPLQAASQSIPQQPLLQPFSPMSVTSHTPTPHHSSHQMPLSPMQIQQVQHSPHNHGHRSPQGSANVAKHLKAQQQCRSVRPQGGQLQPQHLPLPPPYPVSHSNHQSYPGSPNFQSMPTPQVAYNSSQNFNMSPIQQQQQQQWYSSRTMANCAQNYYQNQNSFVQSSNFANVNQYSFSGQIQRAPYFRQSPMQAARYPNGQSVPYNIGHMQQSNAFAYQNQQQPQQYQVNNNYSMNSWQQKMCFPLQYRPQQQGFPTAMFNGYGEQCDVVDSSAGMGTMNTGMPHEAYQRTFEYVCQQQQQQHQEVLNQPIMGQSSNFAPQANAKKLGTPGSRGILSPNGSCNKVSSSCPTPVPQTQIVSNCRAQSSASMNNANNMVINDMNSTLTSLVEETRFLKMTN